MDLEDHGSFEKQRRNLTLVSAFLIFSTLVTVDASELTFFNIKVRPLDPSAVGIAIWLLAGYWLLRYMQYFVDTERVKLSQRYRVEFLAVIRRALPGQFVRGTPQKVMVPEDLPNAKREISITNFSVMETVPDFVAVSTDLTLNFSVTTATGATNTSRAFKGETVTFAGWRRRWLHLVASSRLLLLTPAGTEYLLPPVLFALATIAHLYK